MIGHELVLAACAAVVMSTAARVIHIGEVAETPRTPRGTVASEPRGITCDEST